MAYKRYIIGESKVASCICFFLYERVFMKTKQLRGLTLVVGSFFFISSGDVLPAADEGGRKLSVLTSDESDRSRFEGGSFNEHSEIGVGVAPAASLSPQRFCESSRVSESTLDANASFELIPGTPPNRVESCDISCGQTSVTSQRVSSLSTVGGGSGSAGDFTESPPASMAALRHVERREFSGHPVSVGRPMSYSSGALEGPGGVQDYLVHPEDIAFPGELPVPGEKPAFGGYFTGNNLGGMLFSRHVAREVVRDADEVFDFALRALRKHQHRSVDEEAFTRGIEVGRRIVDSGLSLDIQSDEVLDPHIEYLRTLPEADDQERLFGVICFAYNFLIRMCYLSRVSDTPLDSPVHISDKTTFTRRLDTTADLTMPVLQLTMLIVRRLQRDLRLYTSPGDIDATKGWYDHLFKDHSWKIIACRMESAVEQAFERKHAEGSYFADMTSYLLDHLLQYNEFFVRNPQFSCDIEKMSVKNTAIL